MAKSPNYSTPETVLKRNRERSESMAHKLGVEPTRKLLEKAARDLVARIKRQRVPREDADETFSVTQMRVLLTQVREVLRPLQTGLKGVLTEHAKTVAEASATGAIEYLKSAEKKFTGINQPLGLDEASIVDDAVSGANASVLRRIASDPTHRGRPGVIDRYGLGVIDDFESVLQQRFITRKPWAEVREEIVEQSPFLRGKPAHWAERIVRTELANVENSANHAAIVSAGEQLDDMVKVLFCVDDSRTGADSLAVHGQIRKTTEPFDTWFGQFMHPPDRPNDRAVVIPHRLSWPTPESFAPKSDSEILSRWRAEGRKGSPPPRPKLSTVVSIKLPKPKR